ncbi:MAG: hypothetical protein PHD01_14460, partial [Geobacteraceae bacterium]|nr:hypothetical protein [Geobacteraceae bacterium]
MQIVKDFINKFSKEPEHAPLVPVVSEQVQDLPDEKGKIGWVSPSYNISRSVTLDKNAILANRCVASL